MRFVFLTMDVNHSAALHKAADTLRREYDLDLQLSLYDSTMLRDEAGRERLTADLARADFVFGAMLFGEDIVRPLQSVLENVDAPVCVITSNPAMIRCTKIGRFVLAKPVTEDDNPGIIKRWMNKLRPQGGVHEGQRQLAFLRNLGKVMKRIPGKMRDVHTYISAHDYWLHSSPENLERLLALLIERYVPGYEDALPARDPIIYPDRAIYHPDAPEPFADMKAYRAWRGTSESRGTVGLLSLRTVILSGSTSHLDALIRALEARGLEVITAYAAGLDFRPAIDAFFTDHHTGESAVDVLLNGAGFSLIGGMAESRPDEARAALEQLNVAYRDMIPLTFQTVSDWQASDAGLSPIQLAMNIAIPELDGSAEPHVFGGPGAGREAYVALHDQITVAANRIQRQVRLHRRANADKRVAVVLFNFPPTLGNIGTAAYLDVFNSLYRLLCELRDTGYDVEVPTDVDALREAVVEGNAMQYGTDGNVADRLPLDDYRRLFPYYPEMEAQWGYPPGDLLTDGRDFYILGAYFGSVFVGIQPSFGYERDPMRLLMAKNATPHHGFAAFYTWLEHVYDADAVVHFGTHGALEFMPGKQTGMSADCWPTRLIGGLPNLYYYSVNNPSEATIAKRRGAATTISYMVPPLQQAGLYKGLRLLRDNLDRYRAQPDTELLADIRVQADQLGIGVEANPDDESYAGALAHELLQIEHRMIPTGLHVLGKPLTQDELIDNLALAANFYRIPRNGRGDQSSPPLPQLIAHGLGADYAALRDSLKTDTDAQAIWQRIDTITREAVRHALEEVNSADAYLKETAGIPAGKLAKLWAYLDDLRGRMLQEREIDGLLRGLDGGYIPPTPGNDVVRNPAVVPTGRNIHGLDPFRAPTPAAHASGESLVREMLAGLGADGTLPETIAIVLWGTDNLKSECEGVAQVLYLLGARAIPDELGNISDVELIPLETLGRPRIDVVVTVSGIFRDLLYHQMGLIDKAVHLAAEANEPKTQNFVRAHTLAHAAALDIPVDEAAARVFSNAPGQYGANVNHLVESSTWESDDEMSEAFMTRKCFAYERGGELRSARNVMEQSLATVGATFQNIDSFEIGISDVDHYYEYLGGTTKAVEKLRGERPPVLVADAISTGDRVSSLQQMVRLESRAKLLNPKWYDAMLEHGYEGVQEIETRVGNTYGWSATADAVEGWVYDDVATTYLLDEVMRARMAAANPHATAGIARRLLEAEARGHWSADDNTLDRLRDIYGNLEDQMEGILAVGS